MACIRKHKAQASDEVYVDAVPQAHVQRAKEVNP